MRTKVLINDFATRCFRDVADQDYIAARMCYRAGLIPQFHWSALQAIEKYLKAILLYNRVKANNVWHDLESALRLTDKLPFTIVLSDCSKELIKHINRFGKYRYLESSYYIYGPKLAQFDKTVWEIRRYCRVLNYDVKMRNGKTANMLVMELEMIRKSGTLSATAYRLHGGLLENTLDKKGHPARGALQWKNLFFGSRRRRTVEMPTHFHSTNAPLTLHPEILEEVVKYVHLPKEVIKAYRKELGTSG